MSSYEHLVETPNLPENVVHVASSSNNEDVGKRYTDKYFYLGTAQIILGTISIIFEIASIAYAAGGIDSSTYHAYNYGTGILYLGSGIWCGIFFIVSGILGVVSARTPRHCPIIAAMVMTIFSALAGSTLFGFQITVSVVNGEAVQRIYFKYGNIINNREVKAALSYLNTLAGLHGTIAVVALAALIVAIVHSAYCCAATCCRNASQQVPMYVIGQVPNTTFPQPYVGFPRGQQVVTQQTFSQQIPTQPPVYSAPTAAGPGQPGYYAAQGQQQIPQQQPVNCTAENTPEQKYPLPPLEESV